MKNEKKHFVAPLNIFRGNQTSYTLSWVSMIRIFFSLYHNELDTVIPLGQFKTLITAQHLSVPVLATCCP